jgi:hypothetical protein
VKFPNTGAYHTLKTLIPQCVELQDPRPAPPDNDAPEERRRPHRHTTSEHGNGPAERTIRLETEVNSREPAKEETHWKISKMFGMIRIEGVVGLVTSGD